MAFTSCILFTSVTSEQNTTSKGHLALKKATISRECDVHSCIFHPLTSISINVRTNMSFICQGVMNQRLCNLLQPLMTFRQVSTCYILDINYGRKLYLLSTVQWCICRASICRLRGLGFGSRCRQDGMLRYTNFFLLIEDYGDSKSRTKIGVSVDTKV